MRNIELLQNFADIILNPRPGISFSLKWNGFTFHKRNQFPRNYYPSLFADRMLKSHSILYSSGWTQFSSSIKPPKTQSLWKFLCTHKVSAFSLSCRRGPWNVGERIQSGEVEKAKNRFKKNDSRSVIEGDVSMLGSGRGSSWKKKKELNLPPIF